MVSEEDKDEELVSESATEPTRPLRRFHRVALSFGFFSLVALLLWLTIAPNVIRRGTRGPLTMCKSNLKNLGTALEIYSTDHAGRYPISLNEVIPKYLKALPICPTAGYSTYRATFGLKAPFNTGDYQDYYYLECTGAHHHEAGYGVEPNFPAYNAIDGLIERAPGPSPL